MTVQSPVSTYRVVPSVGRSASMPMINMHPPKPIQMAGGAAVMDPCISDPRLSLGGTSDSSSFQLDGSITNIRQPGMVPIGVHGMPCQAPEVTVTSPALGSRNV